MQFRHSVGAVLLVLAGAAYLADAAPESKLRRGTWEGSDKGKTGEGAAKAPETPAEPPPAEEAKNEAATDEKVAAESVAPEAGETKPPAGEATAETASPRVRPAGTGSKVTPKVTPKGTAPGTKAAEGQAETSPIAPPKTPPANGAPKPSSAPKAQPLPEGAEPPAAPAEAPAAAAAEGAKKAPGKAETPADADKEKARRGKIEIQPQDASPVGETGKIYQGEIDALKFLEFLSYARKVPVLYDSDMLKTPKQINIVSDMVATYDVVKAILEINKFTIVERELTDKTLVIEVSAPQTRAGGEAVGTKVLEFGEHPEVAIDRRADEVATIVVQLKYAELDEVKQVLNGVLGGVGGATAGARGPTSGAGYSLIDIVRTNTLIIKAKLGLMKYIQEIIKRVDVSIPDEEQIIEIIDVKEADATELARLIEDILQGASQDQQQQRAGTTPGASSAQAMLRQRSMSQTRSSLLGRGRSSGMYGTDTMLFPDMRTQRIVVLTNSEYELELVRTLVEELDTEVTNVRRRTHLYQVKYLTAEDVAGVLMELIEGVGRMGGLSGRTSGTRTSRTSRLTSRTGTTQQQTGQTSPTSPTGTQRTRQPGTGMGEEARIVSHEQTNSLLIQADPEVFDEILYILNGIDRKRNQVFLETALVQVSEKSDLNFTIELLAGSLDDQATRMAAMTSLGLSTLDVTKLPGTFDRMLMEGAPTTGLISAVSHKGQLPVLMRFFKRDNESQVVATPFILADDNESNSIEIITTTYILTTDVLNQNTSSTRPTGEDAGVILTITPTISRNAVLLEFDLEVSQFAAAATIAGNLPDKSTNRVSGKVSVPDGQLLVIGGLTTESMGRSVDKVPLLGDIPIIGFLFQSKSVSQTRSNLYSFMTAHVLSDRYFRDVENLTEQAKKGVATFKEAERIKLENFTAPPRIEDGRDEDRGDSRELRPIITPYRGVR